MSGRFHILESSDSVSSEIAKIFSAIAINVAISARRQMGPSVFFMVLYQDSGSSEDMIFPYPQ